MSEDAPCRAPETVDAADAMTALEARQPLPLLYRIAFLGVAMYRAEGGDTVAPAPLRAQVESLGCRSLGRFSFPGILYGRTPREAWIDSSGTVGISLRRASAKTDSRVEQMMAIYSLQTYFDEGSTLVTYGKKKEGPSAPRHERVGGTGFIDQDLAAHRLSVAGYAADRKALVFRDLEAFLRAETFADTRGEETSAVLMLTARVLKLGVAVGIAYLLSRLI